MRCLNLKTKRHFLQCYFCFPPSNIYRFTGNHNQIENGKTKRPCLIGL
jgi:hypothetical protein